MPEGEYRIGVLPLADPGDGADACYADVTADKLNTDGGAGL
jgi:hypothetical protein